MAKKSQTDIWLVKIGLTTSTGFLLVVSSLASDVLGCVLLTLWMHFPVSQCFPGPQLVPCNQYWHVTNIIISPHFLTEGRIQCLPVGLPRWVTWDCYPSGTRWSCRCWSAPRWRGRWGTAASLCRTSGGTGSPRQTFTRVNNIAEYLSSSASPLARQPPVLVIILLVPAPGGVVQTLSIAGQELGQLEAGAAGPGRDARTKSRPHDEVLPVTLGVVLRPIVLQTQVVAQLMGDDESCGAQGPEVRGQGEHEVSWSESRVTLPRPECSWLSCCTCRWGRPCLSSLCPCWDNCKGPGLEKETEMLKKQNLLNKTCEK